MCTTTTHWATHISTECSLGGSGQCDATCIEHGKSCTCRCHTTTEDIGQTTEAVRDWHDEQEGVVASFEKGDQGEQWSEAMNACERLNDKPVDGTLYKVVAGQRRTVVVWAS